MAMFPTSWSCRATVVAVMMMMMMMMTEVTEAAAMLKGGEHLKHPVKTHKVETVPLQLDPKALVPSKHGRPLESASISPWSYNVSYDESLYPQVLSEARCLLQGCLNSEGQEDLNLESRPIMHQVLVLRRVKPAGEGQSYHYRLEYRVVAVGCTCVRPLVHLEQ